MRSGRHSYTLPELSSAAGSTVGVIWVRESKCRSVCSAETPEGGLTNFAGLIPASRFRDVEGKVLLAAQEGPLDEENLEGDIRRAPGEAGADEGVDRTGERQGPRRRAILRWGMKEDEDEDEDEEA
jgi:hypothetical protein